MAKISDENNTEVTAAAGDLVPIYRPGQLESAKYVVDLADKADASIVTTVANKADTTYVDAQDALLLPLAGGEMSGNLTFDATSKITFNAAYTPSADEDAATKAYVDANSGASSTYYNVVDYGAVADGDGGTPTNSQVGIQAAIDAAYAAGGGTVYIPAGTYAIGDNADSDEVTVAGPPNTYRFPAEDAHGVRLKDDVNIIAEQGAKLIIHPDTDRVNVVRNPVETTGSFTVVYVESGGSNFAVEGLEIDGDFTNAPLVTGGECLNFKQCSNIKVSRCVIRNANDDGLDLDGCTDVIVDRCEFYRCGATGIHCAGGGVSRISVSSCYFEANCWDRIFNAINGFSTAAIDFVQGQDQVVTSCVFKDNARAITAMSSNLTVSGCTIRNTLVNVPDYSDGYTGPGQVFSLPQIYIKGGVNVTPQGLAGYVVFSGCHIQQNAGNGSCCVRAEDYYIVPGEAFGYAQFSGCDFYAPNGTCFDIQFIQDLQISGCRLRGGSFCYSEEPATTTTYNLIDPNTGSPYSPAIPVVDWRTGRDGNLSVSGCVISEGAIEGYNADGNVVGCTFDNDSLWRGGVTEFDRTGVLLQAEADDWKITGNNVTAGLLFLDVRNGSRDNYIANNTAPGANVKSASSFSDYKNNIFRKLDMGSGAAVNNTFVDNEIVLSIYMGSPEDNFWRGNYGAGMSNRVDATDVGIDPDLPARGIATLTGGTATVDHACAISDPRFRVKLSAMTAGGTQGNLSIGTINDGVDFEILSDSGTDTSTVYWEIDSTA